MGLGLLGFGFDDFATEGDDKLVAHFFEGASADRGVDVEFLFAVFELLADFLHLRFVDRILEVGKPVNGVCLHDFLAHESGGSVLNAVVIDEGGIGAIDHLLVDGFQGHGSGRIVFEFGVFRAEGGHVVFAFPILPEFAETFVIYLDDPVFDIFGGRLEAAAEIEHEGTASGDFIEFLGDDREELGHGAGDVHDDGDFPSVLEFLTEHHEGFEGDAGEAADATAAAEASTHACFSESAAETSAAEGAGHGRDVEHVRGHFREGDFRVDAVADDFLHRHLFIQRGALFLLHLMLHVGGGSRALGGATTGKEVDVRLRHLGGDNHETGEEEQADVDKDADGQRAPSDVPPEFDEGVAGLGRGRLLVHRIRDCCWRV